MVPLDDAVPRRALYALTPATGARPAAHRFVAELGAALEDTAGIDRGAPSSKGT